MSPYLDFCGFEKIFMVLMIYVFITCNLRNNYRPLNVLSTNISFRSFHRHGIFFVNFDIKNGCKNEFEDNNEKYAADSKIRPPLKSILEPIELMSPTRQPGS